MGVSRSRWTISAPAIRRSATLHAFPFDKIKLDQSFVQRVPEDTLAAAIVKTVLALARKASNVPVLAEGIETEAATAAFLISEGCAEGQGYLLAKPVHRSSTLPASDGAFAATASGSMCADA